MKGMNFLFSFYTQKFYRQEVLVPLKINPIEKQ